MRTDSGPSFFDPVSAAAQQSGRRTPLAPFLALTLFLPAVIVIGNFVIATLTPITWAPDDDMSLIDPVWRLVQGQHFGTDFHDPLGFGLFHMAALLWRLLGPHYYVLRAAVDLFALVIILCGCVVATRRLPHKAGLAALFCITVALTASGPSNNGSHDFGMALTYNRLITSGLAVLFVQSFAKDSDFQWERDYKGLFTAAFLLNILFLVKISGLVLGLAIVAGGLIVRDRPTRGLVDFSLILLFLAIMVAIDFVITGTGLFPVIQDYRLAAQARIRSYSVIDALYFASRWPILRVVALMALYAVSQPGRKGSGNLWYCFFIIAFYWACQVLLNMSNWGPSRSLIYLAPAAVVAVVTWTDTSDSGAFWDHLWSRFYPRRLHEIPAREVIPLLILALVLAPEALASFRAVKLDYSISSGTVKPTAVTASKGITFETYGAGPSPFVLSVNRAVQAIEGLGASRETIVNLDSANPFPALFLAPSPKGVSVFWDFGYNVPIGYEPSWQEVIGDACLVTEPKNPWPPMPTSKRLIAAVQSHLASAFTLVYQDELWKIWKHSGGCDATDGASPIAAEKQSRIR
jgi:hypothetical protein